MIKELGSSTSSNADSPYLPINNPWLIMINLVINLKDNRSGAVLSYAVFFSSQEFPRGESQLVGGRESDVSAILLKEEDRSCQEWPAPMPMIPCNMRQHFTKQKSVIVST